MNRDAAAILALLAAAALAGCGAFEPFPTLARGVQVGQPTGARVGICYNPLATAQAELEKDAQQQCAAGTKATQVDVDSYLETCPILLPTRASFVCIPNK